MTEGISCFIWSVSALNFSLICFSIIELLFFRSAVRTHLHSCLSFFVVMPGKMWGLKDFFFARLTCVCERCSKTARHFTWGDGLASCMDCSTPLCKRESPSAVQYAPVKPAPTMFLPISRLLSYSDRLSSLSTLAFDLLCFSRALLWDIFCFVWMLTQCSSCQFAFPWLMLLTVLQSAVQFFRSSLFQRCYTGCLPKCECFSPVHLPAAVFDSCHQSSAGLLSQTVWLIWFIPLSEGGDKSRAANRNRSFLNPMDVEVTAEFKSMFWRAALHPRPGL